MAKRGPSISSEERRNQINQLNQSSAADLRKMSWENFKDFTLAERQLFKGATRIRAAVAYKEYMLNKAVERKAMYNKDYYEAMLLSLESLHLAKGNVRVKEGVTQTEHMANIIKAAKNLDQNFIKVLTKILDEYIDCATAGMPKVSTSTPDSIIYSSSQELSAEERRLLRTMKSLGNTGNISIYGHKYDPFSPTFGDDIYLALDTIIVNITAAYNYAKEHKLEKEFFTSPWWLACVDGAASNIAGVWLMIEAPNQGGSTENVLVEFARGTVPVHALPNIDFMDPNEFCEKVIEPYMKLADDADKNVAGFIKKYKDAPFRINGEALFTKEGTCSASLAPIVEAMIPISTNSSPTAPRKK